MVGPRALLAALWALGTTGAAALRIGAFNIQSFGDNKVSDPACGGVIAQVRLGTGDRAAARFRCASACACVTSSLLPLFQILAGYDIMLVQEVRDPDLSAVSALMEQINRCGGQGPVSGSLASIPGLGLVS